ncbi:MAG: pilus assembly protein [Elusimicrobia bacterium]|nr:pilus assembly protein [Elusimicrobiota bacterium]MBU2614222.1 pilus assembly protein [Elusimicrobiota bacterium]
MKQIKHESGQAVLETFVVLIVLIPIIFATIQLSIIAFGAIVAYDAAQSANRAAIVQTNDRFAKTKALLAGTYVMSTQISGTKNIVPTTVDVKGIFPANKYIADHEGNRIYAYDVTQNYIQNVMFPSLINPFPGSKFFSGGLPVLNLRANSRMVRTPDPTYFKKAYSNANNW